MLKKLNSQNFESEIAASTTLVDFYADWCGPCQMIAPIVEEIAAERTDIKVGKVNIDEEFELAREFGVMSIPTLVVLEGGKILRQSTGARPKQQILEMLN